MFDAIMRGALAAVNLTPEDAHKLVTDAFQKVADIDARLSRIERALNIRNIQPVETIDLASEENDNGERQSAAG